MSDDGYTLAEMLAALVIIGLAVEGLAECVRALRLTQAGAARTVAETQTLGRARRGLVRVLDGQGPFKSGDRAGLKGGATGFDFECKGGGRCGVQLMASRNGMALVMEGENGWRDVEPLPGVGQARLVYVTPQGRLDVWPVDGPARTLTSVSLEAQSHAGPYPLMAARVWSEQVRDCAFDPIIDDCRAAAP